MLLADIRGFWTNLDRMAFLACLILPLGRIANFLNGLGGAGYGLSHAQKTAEIYEGMDISMIEVSSLTLVPKTILYRRRERGAFFTCRSM